MSFSVKSIAVARIDLSRFGVRPRFIFKAASLLLGASVLLGFFFFPITAHAQLSLQSRVGFHGVFQLGRPFPFSVEIGNSGASAEGVIELRVWKGGATRGGAPYPVIFRKEVFVPSQGRKSVQFTIDPDFISRPVTVTLSTGAGEVKQEIDLRRSFSPAPVILLVSEAAAAPPIFLSATAANHVVALSLAELPADPRAWLGVSHVIFYDQSLRDLSRAQLSALDTWLVAGGKMVILGSLNYALYQEPAINRFMPVRVTGARLVTFSLPVTGNKSASMPAGPVWAQASTPLAGGRVVAEADGLPALVENARGKGRITYLAFDVGRPPLSQWPGLSALLQNLLAPGFGENAPPRTRWDDAVFSQIMLSPSFASAYVPTGSLLIGMLSYLAAIGAFVWFWQQRRRSSNRGFGLAFAGLIVAASASGYLLFSRGGNIPDGVLFSATVLENNSEGFADAQTNIALFSTQLRSYNLQLGSNWMDFTPVLSPGAERAEPVLVHQAAGGDSRYQFDLKEWDYRLFRMKSILRFPVRAEFTPQGDKLLMKITNQSARDLTGCWLVTPAQRYAVGDIPHGTTRSATFSVAPPNQNGETFVRPAALDMRDIQFNDKTEDVLVHASFFPREGEAADITGGNAVFFGWVKNAEPRARLDAPRIETREYTLFRVTVPLSGPEDE